MIKAKNDWLTRQTGDRFADTGGYVFEWLNQKYPERDIYQQIEAIARIYIYSWDQKLDSFFANSRITHNSKKGKLDESFSAILIYFRQVINDDPLVVAAKNSFCRITGQRTTLFSAERTNSILNGSGGLMNFHHALEGGSLVSKEIIIRNFLMPFGVVQVGANPAVLTSNNEEVVRHIVFENCKAHTSAIGMTSANRGLRKAIVGNPTNALFSFAGQSMDLIKKREEDEPNTEAATLNLFHFSNFVNGTALQLYNLPSSVFGFHVWCLSRFRKEWTAFINSSYRVIEKKNKTEGETFAPETFKNWLFETLLKEGKISGFAKSWVIKGNRLSFKIIEIYQIKIRNMEKQSITVLRRIAIFVVTDRSDDDIKRTVRLLNEAKKERDVRRALLKLVKENYYADNDEVLIPLDDVTYLFPEGFNWVEMRDILVIGIYEQLHLANRKVAGDLGDTDEDLNEKVNNDN